jgi:hypothetical protein
MNINNKRAVVITRKHPKLNFGQTLNVLESNKASAIVKADGDTVKHSVDISEIWFYDRTHDYEAYNDAVSKAEGWTWQLNK